MVNVVDCWLYSTEEVILCIITGDVYQFNLSAIVLSLQSPGVNAMVWNHIDTFDSVILWFYIQNDQQGSVHTFPPVKIVIPDIAKSLPFQFFFLSLLFFHIRPLFLSFSFILSFLNLLYWLIQKKFVLIYEQNSKSPYAWLGLRCVGFRDLLLQKY